MSTGSKVKVNPFIEIARQQNENSRRRNENSAKKAIKNLNNGHKLNNKGEFNEPVMTLEIQPEQINRPKSMGKSKSMNRPKSISKPKSMNKPKSIGSKSMNRRSVEV